MKRKEINVCDFIKFKATDGSIILMHERQNLGILILTMTIKLIKHCFFF